MPAWVFFFCALLSAAGGVASQMAADEETRRATGLQFDELQILGDLEVEISQGDVTELQMRGAAQQLDEPPFYVKGSTLVLGSQKRAGAAGSASDQAPLRFRVVTPSFAGLTVKGSAKVYIKPFDFSKSQGERGDTEPPVLALEGSGDVNAFELRGTGLEVRVEGSGNFRAVRIDVDSLTAVIAGGGHLFVETLQASRGEFTVTGSGDAEVTGQGAVETLEVNVVGSGDIRMSMVNSRRAESNIVGSGSAWIGEVSEQLNASVLGSGEVVYGGSPEVERVELGSGE
ncbi:MAG: DUF2807 domain-containing protein, partial [Congregibacter sp.]|nr:DUF2807 domain-containing protein [Congregibacter sp.]